MIRSQRLALRLFVLDSRSSVGSKGAMYASTVGLPAHVACFSPSTLVFPVGAQLTDIGTITAWFYVKIDAQRTKAGLARIKRRILDDTSTAKTSRPK
jgi:hypothetical protein